MKGKINYPDGRSTSEMRRFFADRRLVRVTKSPSYFQWWSVNIETRHRTWGKPLYRGRKVYYMNMYASIGENPWQKNYEDSRWTRDRAKAEAWGHTVLDKLENPDPVPPRYTPLRPREPGPANPIRTTE